MRTRRRRDRDGRAFVGKRDVPAKCSAERLEQGLDFGALGLEVVELLLRAF